MALGPDGAFYRKVKDEPLKVRGSLYLTLFCNRRTAQVPFGDRSVPVASQAILGRFLSTTGSCGNSDSRGIH